MDWKFGSLVLIGFTLSYGVVYLFRLYAQRKHWLAVPNARSSHMIPTPVGGGIGIVVSVLLLGLWGQQVIQPAMTASVWWVYILAGLGVAIVGWWDDVYHLSQKSRFLIQFGASAGILLFIGFFQTIDLPILPVMTWEIAGMVITFGWIVWLINAYNFMDGIDGIAAGQAIVASLFWFILFLQLDLLWLAFFSLLLAGATFGFLLHNMPPAHIFMGDVGSTFLGFTFAVLPIIVYQLTENARLLVVGSLFVAPFIFDAGVTILIRLYRRENILQAHRSHIYQRLTQQGFSHGHISFLYVMLACVTGVSGLVYFHANVTGMIFATVTPFVVLMALLGTTMFLEQRKNSL